MSVEFCGEKMKKFLSILFLIMVGTAFADDTHGFIEPTIGGFTIKDTNDIRMMDEVVEIWDIDNMTYHWGCFSYKPTSIKYDKKSKETVLTWVLENIEPRKEWEATEYRSSIRSPDDEIQEFAYVLIKDELFKIPGYSNDSKWWLDDEYRNNSASDWGYKEFANKEKFYAWVRKLYESGFTEFQPKTKVAGVYAQLLINSIYAIHGYKFKNESWTQKFSKFDWYEPTTSEISNADFSIEEKLMLKRLMEYR